MRWPYTVAVVLMAVAPGAAQTPAGTASTDLPPTGYLQGTPPDSVIQGYLCPMHPHVTAEQKGQTCYLCGMDLVDGRIRMPHASHDPHHGGIFFMSRDNWHHIEGTMPEPGVFRFYLYDNYSIPLPVLQTAGRLVFQEFRDADGKETRAPVAAPLTPASDGVSFSVIDDRLALGRDFHVRIRFRPDQTEEDRFDFAYYGYSTFDAGAAPKKYAGDALAIPDTPLAILEAMDTRMKDVDTLIRQNRLNELFFSALEAKDLALSLLDHAGDLDEDDTRAVTLAVKAIVRAAWRLDLYGDYGDRPAAERAFSAMSAAAAQIRGRYAPSAP